MENDPLFTGTERVVEDVLDEQVREDGIEELNPFAKRQRKKTSMRVINFVDIPPPHSGVVVNDALYKCLVEWEIESKLASITVDNASYNDVVVRTLKDSISCQAILPYGGKLYHVRCCTHILNILVHDGLEEIKDVLYKVRESVKHVIASIARLNIFNEICKQLKGVFPWYKNREPSYNLLPSDEEWKKVEVVCSFLSLLNQATEIISGSEYPTSNLFLPELTNIKEALESQVESDYDFMREMAQRMRVKFDKYWGNCNLLISVAAALDPRNKLKLIEWSFSTLYLEDELVTHTKYVRDTLYEIYLEYVEAHSLNNSQKTAHESDENYSAAVNVGPSNTGKNKIFQKGRKRFDSFIRSGYNTFESIKSEIDVYLEEGVVICDEESDDFDILQWWKANNLKFRILSKMTCDILAIPITSVASKSTFSAGGRVIDSYRVSLRTSTVQMLMCTEDWLRSFHGIKRKQKVIEEFKIIDLP
uniref:Transposase n=1 Tax=Chenopodium quinoa TaxID=63459 RepID=A0A803MY25_CHEQI